MDIGDIHFRLLLAVDSLKLIGRACSDDNARSALEIIGAHVDESADALAAHLEAQPKAAVTPIARKVKP